MESRPCCSEEEKKKEKEVKLRNLLYFQHKSKRENLNLNLNGQEAGNVEKLCIKRREKDTNVDK